MEFEIWIKSLKEVTQNQKDPKNVELAIGLLKEFEQTIAEKRLIPHNDPKIIFQYFQELFFKTNNPKIIVELLNIMELLIDVCSHDIEIFIDIILANVIDSIFDTSKQIRDSAHRCIIKYISNTRNIDKIWIKYYSQGLTSRNLTVRTRSIRGMQNIIEYDPTVLSNEKNSAFGEFRKCIESLVIYHKNETSQTVKDAALSTLITLIKNYDLQKLYSYLAVEHQNALEDIQNKYVNKHYKSNNIGPVEFEIDFDEIKNEAKKIKLNFGKLKFKDKDGKRMTDLEQENEEEVQINNYCTLTGTDYDIFISKNGLVFNLIPKNLFFESLEFEKDWKVRQYALEDITKLIRNKNVYTELTHYEQYNLTRYLYLQFTGGSKKGFIADCIQQADEDFEEESIPNSQNNTQQRFSKTNYNSSSNKNTVNGGFKFFESEKTVEDKTNPFKVNPSAPQRSKNLAMRTFDKSFKPKEEPEDEIVTKNIINFNNTPKINILLLLCAEKLLSLDSNILLEPIIALLSLEHTGIRSLSFLFLSNLQRLYKNKSGCLQLLYIEALKIKKSWHLKEEILKLITLLFWDTTGDFEYDGLRVVKSIAKLLDDRVAKVKKTAMNCLIIMCNHSVSFKVQEILLELLDKQVFNYLADNINSSYDIVTNLKKFIKEAADVSLKDHDFVAEIILSDPELMYQIRNAQEYHPDNNKSLNNFTIEKNNPSEIFDNSNHIQQQQENRISSNEIKFMNNMVDNIQFKLKSQTDIGPKKAQDNQNLLETEKDNSFVKKSQKGGVMFEIDQKEEPITDFTRKFEVKISKEFDLRERTKDIKLLHNINKSVSEYDKYAYTKDQIDDQWRQEQIKSVLQTQNKLKSQKKDDLDESDIIDEVMNEYLHPQHKNYNGEYYDADQDFDPGYNKYAKDAEFGQDFQAARAYRNKMHKNMMYNTKKGIAKGEISLRFNEISYKKWAHLKPLINAPQFIENYFHNLIDEKKDSITTQDTLNKLRSLLKFHIEYIYDHSFSIEQLIDYVCDLLDCENLEILKTCLIFLSELSFYLQKVLDNKLETLLASLFHLYERITNDDIKYRVIKVLKTLSKYSTDIKQLHYIILMPLEMFIRHKTAAVNCMCLILQKDVNIFMFEDEELIKLMQLVCAIFEGAELKISEMGEEILCLFFDKFKKTGRLQKFFYWLQIHLKETTTERVRRILNTNFKELNQMINDDRIVRVSFDESLKKTERPFPENDKIFHLNSQNVIKPQVYHEPEEILLKNSETKNTFTSKNANRDFNIQNRLMGEIELLLKN